MTTVIGSDLVLRSFIPQSKAMKRKGNKIIAFALGSLLFITGCSPEEPSSGLLDYTVVKGRLLDASTHEPVAGGTITIIETDYATMEHDFLDTVTNALGEYYFKFSHVKGRSYLLAASAPNYWTNRNISSWQDIYPLGRPTPLYYINRGRIINKDIILPPVGYLRYHIINQEHQQDYLNIDTQYDLGNPFVGLNVDVVTPPEPVKAGTKYPRVIYFGSPLDSARYDSIYVPRFDTATHLIIY